MRQADFPFGIGRDGRTGMTEGAEYVRDLVEQVLFTSPGERVNRPDFGTPVRELVFEPNSPELASATRLSVQAALQQWLADVIDVRDVSVTSQDSMLIVEVSYVLRGSGLPRRDRFSVEA